MKIKTYLSFLLLFFSVLSSLNAQSRHYYYYKGNKINLTIDKNYVNVIADDDLLKSSESTQLFRMFQLEQGNYKSIGGMVKLKFKSTLDSQGYLKTVELLKETPQVKHVFPFFERGDSEPIGTSDVFYLKLKETKDTVLLKEITKQQNVQIIKQIPYMPLWYILSIRNSMFTNSVDASNYFYETALFEDVDPAFMFNFKPNCANDPQFSQLWGLSNTSDPNIDINACDAWIITQGEGISVAVVDQGIDLSHYDLYPNIHSLSFDAQSGTSPSIFRGTEHGTHVAGTIAAVRNNNLQITGVAPESEIMGVSHDMYISNTFSAELASGISWAWQNGADVINNSWGDWGGRHSQMYSTILENAIIDAMTQGRGGKGCVVVFASGNTWLSNRIDYPGSFHDNILTVGAINSNGTRASSSNYGNKLDVVAPGSDILSTLPNNSTGSRDGTSFATPHVAGVAALILSVKPTLTGQQVRDMIESTAQKVGGYNYQLTPNRPNGTWHEEMGYGLVDAYAAVQKATCTVYFTNQTVSTDTYITSCGDINVENVKVRNGAKLTLDAAGEVNIIRNFEVDSGSEFEIE